MADEPDRQRAARGISRRKLIRGGVVAGGMLVWSAPALNTIALAVDGGGSPPLCIGQGGICFPVGPVCVTVGNPCCSGLDCTPAGPRSTEPCTCEPSP